MLVQQILNGKSSGDIATIPSDAKVSEAAGILSSKHIGALVVSDNGKSVLGMFSERDVVRELGRRGTACLSDCVRDLMTKDIVTCSPDERAHSVLQKMTNGRFRHMPVMKGDTMVGLISIGDVVQARLSEMAIENEALEGMIKGF